MAPLRTTVMFYMHLYITPSNKNHLIPIAFGPYGFSTEDQNRVWRWKPVDFEFFLLAWILSCIYSDFSCLIGFLKGCFCSRLVSVKNSTDFFLCKRSFYFIFIFLCFFLAAVISSNLNDVMHTQKNSHVVFDQRSACQFVRKGSPCNRLTFPNDVANRVWALFMVHARFDLLWLWISGTKRLL